MPLFETKNARDVDQQLDARTFAMLRGVALPQRHFATGPRGVADVLIKRLEDGSGCIVLVDRAVQYLGTDTLLIRYFRNTLVNGWRPLTVLRPADSTEVLRQADILLGLSGDAPRLPEPVSARELNVDSGDLDVSFPQRDADAGRFGADLVEDARKGRITPVLFRAKETSALIRILSKEGKNAACLVGEPGVGKTRVVEHLAAIIAEGNVPLSLRGARILDVNLSMLAAGAVHQNEFEGRMKQLIDLARRDSDTILFLDELHTLRAPTSDASQMMKSDLGRGRIRCVGATTPREFRMIESDVALARRFQVVPVAELTREQTIQVLGEETSRLEKHHGVSIPSELLPVLVDLSMRYVPHRHLPDKAIDLLDEACACARLGMAENLRAEQSGGTV